MELVKKEWYVQFLYTNLPSLSSVNCPYMCFDDVQQRLLDFLKRLEGSHQSERGPEKGRWISGTRCCMVFEHTFRQPVETNDARLSLTYRFFRHIVIPRITL